MVSIVTSTYNQGNFIEETILSVLNQSYDNIEYIIVDSMSTDNTIEILQKYSNQIGEIIREKDDGPSDGLNKGFSLAKGDFLCFINSDDILKPFAIEVLVREILRKQSDLVYGDVNFIDCNGTQLYPFKFPLAYAVKLSGFDLYAKTAVIPQQASLWSRRLHDYGLRFNVDNTTCWDYEFFAEAISSGFSSSPVYQVLASFRMHGDSITGESLSVKAPEMSKRNTRRVIDHKRVLNMLSARGYSVNGFSKLFLKALNMTRRLKRIVYSSAKE